MQQQTRLDLLLEIFKLVRAVSALRYAPQSSSWLTAINENKCRVNNTHRSISIAKLAFLWMFWGNLCVLAIFLRPLTNRNRNTDEASSITCYLIYFTQATQQLVLSAATPPPPLPIYFRMTITSGSFPPGHVHDPLVSFLQLSLFLLVHFYAPIYELDHDHDRAMLHKPVDERLKQPFSIIETWLSPVQSAFKATCGSDSEEQSFEDDDLDDTYEFDLTNPS
jgi:hypothetical protein